MGEHKRHDVHTSQLLESSSQVEVPIHFWAAIMMDHRLFVRRDCQGRSPADELISYFGIDTLTTDEPAHVLGSGLN
jgi:hypothetical protein